MLDVAGMFGEGNLLCFIKEVCFAAAVAASSKENSLTATKSWKKALTAAATLLKKRVAGSSH